MSAEDASKVDCCLIWTREHEIEREQDPGVVWCRDVDNIDMHCCMGVKTGPAVSNGYLQGWKVEGKGGDDSAQRLRTISKNTHKKETERKGKERWL